MGAIPKTHFEITRQLLSYKESIDAIVAHHFDNHAAIGISFRPPIAQPLKIFGQQIPSLPVGERADVSEANAG